MPGKILMAALLLFSAVCVTGQQKFNNDVIIQAVQGGLPEDSIIKMIQVEDGQYILSDSEIARLKKAGVSNRLIQAMTAKMASTSASQQESQVPEPEKESVYYFFDETNNSLVPLTLEFASSQGKAKLGGLGGAKTVVDIPGEQSPTRLKSAGPTTFLVRVQGGPKALAYLPDTVDLSTLAGPLHKFTGNKGKRERTAFEIGSFGTAKDKTGGDTVLVVSRVGGNILKISSTGPLPVGEYGFFIASPTLEVLFAKAKTKADSVYYTFAVVP